MPTDTSTYRSQGFSPVPCPLCTTINWLHPLWAAPDRNWGIGGRFSYVYCTQCDLVFQSPAPTPDCLPGLYPRGYGATSVDHIGAEQRVNSFPNRYRAQLIERFMAGGSLLDIGCGVGYFMAYMQRKGWKVFGLDPAPEHIAVARSRFGLETVIHGAWPTQDPLTIEFDAVTMFHLIEHVPDPVRALAFAREVIKPGGLLVIETPNIECVPALLFRSHWVALDAPRHLVLFSRRSLQRCLRKAGFSRVRIGSYSPSTMEYSESLRYALRTFLRRSPHKVSVKSAQPCRGPKACPEPHVSTSVLTILRHIEKGFYRILNGMADPFYRGCNLIAAAQK